MVSGDETIMFPENSDRAVATYTATDPERDTLSWSVSDRTTFWISSRGQLYFASPPNFERVPTSFSLTVEATDDGGLEGTFNVTVTVTDVEEAGMVSLTPLRGWDGTTFRADLTDGDGHPDSRSWQWERSSNRSSWTDIASANQQFYTAAADDVGNYLRASATYNNGQESASAVLPTRIEDAQRQVRDEHGAGVRGIHSHTHHRSGHGGGSSDRRSPAGHRSRSGRHSHLLAERNQRRCVRDRFGHRPATHESRSRS